MLFNITYEYVTPESAEHGEAEESGFHEEGLTLREAYDFLRWEGDSDRFASDSVTRHARWITFSNSPDMHDGSWKDYSLHFPAHMTASTRARIARLFRVK